MCFDDDRTLAKTWVRRYEIIDRIESDNSESDDLYWVFEKVSDLCAQNPERAWSIILNALEATDNGFVLSNLAAGPLEDLLVRHGSVVLPWASREAARNPKFRDLLMGVWGERIDRNIWLKIQRITSDSED